MITILEVASTGGRSQAWIPLASFSADEWVRVEDNTWQTTALMPTDGAAKAFSDSITVGIDKELAEVRAI